MHRWHLHLKGTVPVPNDPSVVKSAATLVTRTETDARPGLAGSGYHAVTRRDSFLLSADADPWPLCQPLGTRIVQPAESEVGIGIQAMWMLLYSPNNLDIAPQPHPFARGACESTHL